MAWWDDATFELTFDPSAGAGREGAILVGLGNHDDQDNRAILLNHKGTPLGARSVSEYVSKTAEREAERWRAAFPQGMAGVRQIVVEDLSLDTCFALLLFAAIVERRDTGHLASQAWLDYVCAWELGYVVDSDPETSVGCLHTTLSHTYLRYGEGEAKALGTLKPDVLRGGLRDCLAFLSAIIAASPDPTAAVLPRKTTQYSRALSHLRFEWQTYRRALQHGCACQMMVPLESGRKVLVDALILTEDQPSALIKVFARRDRDSFTGNGYTLLAIHRPQAAGTGNDMVISVDPNSGLTLKDLWHRLEDLENRRWGDSRPHDAPRNIVSYQDSNGTVRAGAPDQPWWDDGGRYTLIAAPKRAGTQEGTKLSWDDDVIPALWELYSPFDTTQYEIATTGIADTCRANVQWRQAGATSAAASPTLIACLAQLSRGQEARHPRDLLPPDQYETVRVPGGMVIVHAGGVTIFDDWSNRRVPAQLNELVFDIASACGQFRAIDSAKSLRSAIKLLRLGSKKGEVRLAQLREVKERLLEAKQQLQSATAMAVGGSEGDDVALVRRTLRRWWGIDANREELGKTLNSIDSVISQVQAEQVEHHSRLARWLLSAFFPAVAVKEFIEAVRYLWTPNPHEWAFDLLKGHETAEHLHTVVDTIVRNERIEIGLVVVTFILGLSYAMRGISIKSEE